MSKIKIKYLLFFSFHSIVLVYLLLGSSNSFATEPKIDWTSTYNSPANNLDQGLGIAVDTNGNIYVTGSERRYDIGQADNIWTRKYDSNGIILWTATYNGTGNDWDEGRGIAVDDNGNVYVVGRSSETGKGSGLWLRKYNTNGLVLWTTTYGWNWGNDVALGLSGNIYVIGYDYYNAILICKYSSNGLLLWTTSYKSPATTLSSGNDIAIDSSGNVYVIGEQFPIAGPEYDILLAKYNSNGVIQWTTTYNNPSNGRDRGNGIAVDENGNVYVTGNERRNDINQFDNIWVRKYDTNGLVLWTTTYNGSANDGDYGFDIKVGWDGNVYVTGSETVTGQSQNIWIRKYDTNGFILWTTTYNSPANSADGGYGITVDTWNVYVTGYEYYPDLGQDNNNVWVGKYTKKPTNFVGLVQSISYIFWQWDDNSDDETGFRMKTSTGGTIVDLPANTTFWIEQNLQPNTQYSRYVVAYNASGESNPSNSTSTYTLANSPSNPSNFSGGAISSASINWYWQDNANNETIYYLHSSTHGVLKSLPANTTFYVETGLSANTQYTRHANVYNSGGSADSNSAAVYTLSQPPSNLTSTGQTSNTISLSWTSPAGTATRFSIERAADNNGSPAGWSSIKAWSDNISATTYTDTNLTQKTKYWYRVKSYNGDGVINTLPSEQIGITTPEDVTPPAEPEQIAITPPSGSTEIKPGDNSLALSGKAEAGSSIYSIVIKDQNGNVMARGVDASGVTIDSSGNISGAVSITDLIKNLPLATSITVEIKVKDSAGNISAAGVSQSIKIAVAGAIPQVKLINNLFDPTQSGQKLYIRYELPEASNISVSVHDVTGVEIKKILENVQMPAGAQLIEWAGRNAADEVVASGTYIVYLQAGSYKLRKKVIVMK